MRVIILRKQLLPEQEELREVLKEIFKNYVLQIEDLQPKIKAAQEKLGVLQEILNTIGITFTSQNLVSNPEELGEKAEEIIRMVGRIEHWLDLSKPGSLGRLLYDINVGINFFGEAKQVLADIAENFTKKEREEIAFPRKISEDEPQNGEQVE